MFLRMSALQRRPDVSAAQFRRHWIEVHGSLAASIPNVLRYVQNHVVDTAQRVAHARGGVEVDGFPQLWFADRAAMEAAMATPEATATGADLAAFCRGVSLFDVESNVVVPHADGHRGAKRMTLLYAKDGMGREDFRRHWLAEHGPMVAGFPGIRGYVQHLVVGHLPITMHGVVDAEIDCAGILEMWFDDVAAMDAAFASEPARAAVAHGRAFLSAATTYVVEELPIVG